MVHTDTAVEAEKRKRLNAYALVMSFAILTLGMAAAIVYLVVLNRRLQQQATDLGTLDARERTVQQLVNMTSAIFDSHPDADVGRVLQPNLQNRTAYGSRVSSNAFGWRERPVAIPKPPGTTRIVLLGDSFVFSPGIAAEDRAGVFLEKFLAERLKKPVEVIHLGIGSWNTRAECEYMRRNLSNLAPDAVLQIAVSNDLDDSGSVRGFGAVAEFSTQRPERCVSLYDSWPIWGLALGFKKMSHLYKGLSWESRSRYEDNAQLFEKLAGAVTAAGGKYLLVESWMDSPHVAAHYFSTRLAADRIAYLPSKFRNDPQVQISPLDPHWSRSGSERVAKYLYGALRVRGLLDVPAWDEAETMFRELDAAGLAEGRLDRPLDLSAWTQEVAGAIDFGKLTQDTAAQIYGGVDKEGFVYPYASVVLARGDATRVHVAGRMLDATELRGARVRIFLDDIEAKELVIEPSAALDVVLELPASVRERDFFDVRFVAGDWIYRGPNLRQCVVMKLDRVEAQP